MWKSSSSVTDLSVEARELDLYIFLETQLILDNFYCCSTRLVFYFYFKKLPQMLIQLMYIKKYI